jgi:hypothetical protein
MHMIRKFIAIGLYWGDIAYIGLIAVIGVALGYTGWDLLATTRAEVEAMQVPWQLWKEPARLVPWVISIANWSLGYTILRLWVQFCVAGFCLMAAILALHEALVRFRIRLG